MLRVFSLVVLFAFVCTQLSSCRNKISGNENPIMGTWELIASSSTVGDSVVSTFSSDVRTIKIINSTHFSFLSHDLKMGKDSSNVTFTAGGGRYELNDSVYTEQLEYCNYREWENNTFTFTVAIHGDTLVQKGVEKVENLGINHILTEVYKRAE